MRLFYYPSFIYSWVRIICKSSLKKKMYIYFIDAATKINHIEQYKKKALSQKKFYFVLYRSNN